MKRSFWEQAKNYQTLLAVILSSLAVFGLMWKAFGDPFVCSIVDREVRPIYKTLDYLIACNQATLTPEQIIKADSLYLVNQKWKELRNK